MFETGGRTVRVVVCENVGSVDELRIVERPEPAAGPGQVVIAVEAAGVNYVDALFVQGRYQMKPPVPFIPGCEVAGTISEVGRDVDADRLGERVVTMCGLGGYAERIAVSTLAAVPIPDALDAARGAAFIQSYCTARFALRDRAHVVGGEKVLVLGAGGGVGQATIDVAVAAGATVIAAASTDAKRQAALRAGATDVIDTSKLEGDDDLAQRLVQEVRAWSGGGVDVAFDSVGGSLTVAALRSLGLFGRLLVIGFASGTIPDVPANQVLLRNRSVVGVDWGAWAMKFPTEQRALLDGLLDDVAAGSLRPSAPDERPLTDAVGALNDLLGRRVIGKVVLVP